jgi:hypothetical protein
LGTVTCGASKVKYELDNAFEVQGIIMPEANVMTVTKQKVKNLTKPFLVRSRSRDYGLGDPPR